MPNFIFVKNITKSNLSPARVEYCDSFISRLRGLMFRSRLAPDEGLILVQGRDSRIDASIHMFFVPFDISVFWINANMQVVDKIIAKPWRPAYFPKQGAKYILEIHPTRFTDYEIGNTVEFINA